MIKDKLFKYPYILHAFILYTLANTFLLINFQGIYWDDWAIFNHKKETILSIFFQNGFFWIGYLHVFLQKIGNGVYIYRIFAFFVYFFFGIFLFYILKTIKYFDKQSIFFIVLLFLLAPVDYARIAIINIPAILSLFIFYCSFFLLARYLNSKKTIFNRLIILSLFFISFSLESLLVFYSIVLLFIFLNVYEKNEEG